MNSTWQMPLGSICLPHAYCSPLAQVISIACQVSCPDQVILNDLPASSLCWFKSIIHLYLIFTRIPTLLGSIIHFHLIFTLIAKLPFYYTHLSCHLPLQRPSKSPLPTVKSAFLTLRFIVLYQFASDYIYNKIPLVISCAPDIPSCSPVFANTRDDQICCILYQLKFFKNQCKCHHQKNKFVGEYLKKGTKKKKRGK